jgi:hypothetical protein
MSDEPPRTRRPHPIRLAIFMLIGAGFGLALGPVEGGRGQDFDYKAHNRAMLIAVCGGSIVGGALEYLVRICQRD